MSLFHLQRATVPAVRFGVALALVVLALVAWGAPETAQAQATRTWVSGVGSDANPCSRTAPCQTFAGAISKTLAGGIISCLDPGGFGTVTITKSITIDCIGMTGSILASSTNGVNINAASIKVVLRGVTIHGHGSIPGLRGIRFIEGASLLFDHGFISGFLGFPARGIEALGPTVVGAFHQISVSNSIIADNGLGQSGGGGIVLGNVGGVPPNLGVIRAALSNVVMSRNNIGLRVSPNTEVTVKGSTLESNISFNMVVFSGGGPSLVNVDDCMIAESIAGTGIHGEGPGVSVRVSRSIITGNNIGVASFNGAQVLSSGNNVNHNNFSGNGAFTGASPLS
jgi:hypothetical protein